MKNYWILGLLLVLVLSACSTTPGDIEVHNAWVRPTLQGENAAVYLTLHNHTDADADLLSVSSEVADMIDIHQTTMENDVMQMSMLTSLPIAAGEEINFAPGGLHIMLVNVKQELVLGEHMGLVLHFKDHADIIVKVHIENSMPDEAHDH